MIKKHFFLILALMCVVAQGPLLTSCSKDDDKKSVTPPTPKEYFTLWNQCEALTTLKAYVEDVTNPNSSNYIKEEDRIATFDMDGTFIGELYPTYFEYTYWNTEPWMIPRTRTRLPMMCAKQHRTSAISCVTARNCPTTST